jgi:hypothetical protein
VASQGCRRTARWCPRVGAGQGSAQRSRPGAGTPRRCRTCACESALGEPAHAGGRRSGAGAQGCRFEARVRACHGEVSVAAWVTAARELPPVCIRAQRSVVGADVRAPVHLVHVHPERIRHQCPQPMPLMWPRAPHCQVARWEHGAAIVRRLLMLSTKHTSCRQGRGHRPYDNTHKKLSVRHYTTTRDHKRCLGVTVARYFCNCDFPHLLIVSWERGGEGLGPFNFCYICLYNVSM